MAHNVKLDARPELEGTEPARIVEVAMLLAEREWYGYKAGILGDGGDPCLNDFSNFALCMGRKVSEEECDRFIKAWKAHIDEYRLRMGS